MSGMNSDHRELSKRKIKQPILPPPQKTLASGMIPKPKLDEVDTNRKRVQKEQFKRAKEELKSSVTNPVKREIYESPTIIKEHEQRKSAAVSTDINRTQRGQATAKLPQSSKDQPQDSNDEMVKIEFTTIYNGPVSGLLGVSL